MQGSGRRFELVAAVVQAWSAYRRRSDPAQRVRLGHLATELEHATGDGADSRLREALRAVSAFCARLDGAGIDVDARRQGDLLFARLVESALATLSRADARPDPVRQVVLASGEPGLWVEFAPPLRYFGYRLHRAADAAALRDAMAHGVDAVLLDWRTEATEFASVVRETPDSCPPRVLVLGTGEVSNRLAAVRIRADAYLRAPVEPDRVLDALQSVLAAEHTEPLRVVLLAGHTSDGAVVERALVDGGMEVTTLSDPTTVLGCLEDYPADLVILQGVELPGCRADELTAVIRQIPAHGGLPVMCIDVPEAQAPEYIAAGADAALAPCMPVATLVHHAETRARHGRSLRRHMTADALTGLLNHGRFKQELAREFAMRQRNGGRFTLAMLDLDCFKQINDTYGHPAGDRVIKALARLFSERLRRTDIAGRWGGEEFALIFPEIGATEAGTVLDRLRSRFERLAFGAAGRHFHVTFSAGIAAYPADARDPGALAMQADQALYAAKAAGRNRVMFAGQSRAQQPDAAISRRAQGRR
ncbi:diguanylate cyclase [Arhodomonas sp. AD133]|uniref:GGDEF domain-containing protein n=1 Tax=Arhodomonas sp. AD133 TaxID=3415009 RepID=UPI003EB86B19